LGNHVSPRNVGPFAFGNHIFPKKYTTIPQDWLSFLFSMTKTSIVMVFEKTSHSTRNCDQPLCHILNWQKYKIPTIYIYITYHSTQMILATNYQIIN
jgi:hypothetical protein